MDHITRSSSRSGFAPPPVTEKLETLLKLSVANQRIENLQVELRAIRELLRAQPDKDCLGVGCPITPEECAPWPIVDEVINNITQVLMEK